MTNQLPKSASTLIVMVFLAVSHIALARTVTAPINSTTGKTIGTVTLKLYEEGSVFSAVLWHIKPGWHAIHFHQYPDCSDPDKGFLKSGGHKNIDQNKHGIASGHGFHTGDLSNIYAFSVDSVDAEKTENGHVIQARVEQIVPWVNKNNFKESVAVVLHAEKDDYHSDPTGNAGPRIGCAVLNLQKLPVA